MSLGGAVIFAKYDKDFSVISIHDLSSDQVLTGSFNMTITLDDSRHTSSYTIQLIVLPVPVGLPGTTATGGSGPTSAAAAERETIKALLNSFRSKILEKRSRLSNNKEIFLPPRPHISKVYNRGRLEITFSEEIEPVANLTMINNGTIEIEGKVYPVLEVEVKPGLDSDPEELKFTWEVVAQTPT